MARNKRRKDKFASYAEWLNHQSKLERKRKRKNKRSKVTHEVQKRFIDAKLVVLSIYRRAEAIEGGRKVNPNLVKRDGVWQQRARFTLTVPTTFGNVYLSTSTRGVCVQRTRKRRNSMLRDYYEVDAFNVDSSECLVTSQDDAQILHDDIQIFLENKGMGVRKPHNTDILEHRVAFSGQCPVSGKDIHIPFPLYDGQGKRKTRAMGKRNSDITG